MSLDSSNSKLSSDVDPTVRRAFAAFTRDLEQIFLLLGQGEGGFSNESPGSISQDVTTDGMGVEGNQGDYRFSGPVSQAELEASSGGGIDTSVFLQKSNNLSDVASTSTSRTNLGLGTIATQASSAVSITGGTITGITDLAIADGGTGASTAAAARTNLGSTTVGDAVFIAANAGAGRTALGLGTISTQGSGAVSITGGTITGITDLAIADGGTGASDTTNALYNLAAARFAAPGSADFSFVSTGAGTVTWTAGKKIYFCVIIAAGGGGASGTVATGTGAAAGGGGGAGEMVFAWGKISGATASVTNGTGGGGGTVAANGTAGGDSVFDSITAHGGKGGFVLLGGGAGGAAALNAASSELGWGVIRVPGSDGQAGFIQSVAFNGTGNVTGYTTIGGNGGNTGSIAGQGGDGGSAGSNGTAGGNGRVYVWEF